MSQTDDVVERLQHWAAIVPSPLACACMREAADEIERLREENAWRPTESAPPFVPVLGFFGQTVGDDPSDMAVCRKVAGGWRDDRGQELDEPTHWKPLPAPPSVEETKR